MISVVDAGSVSHRAFDVGCTDTDSSKFMVGRLFELFEDNTIELAIFWWSYRDIHTSHSQLIRQMRTVEAIYENYKQKISEKKQIYIYNSCLVVKFSSSQNHSGNLGSFYVLISLFYSTLLKFFLLMSSCFRSTSNSSMVASMEPSSSHSQQPASLTEAGPSTTPAHSAHTADSATSQDGSVKSDCSRTNSYSISFPFPTIHIYTDSKLDRKLEIRMKESIEQFGECATHLLTMLLKKIISKWENWREKSEY